MQKSFLLSVCPSFIHSYYAKIKFWFRFHFFPKGLANELHRGIVGYDINWKRPQTLNEKINWMKFYADTSSWSILADKYLVRDYVKKRIGGDCLVKLYGVWSNADEIDFRLLPNKFVLKTNHGAGTVLPVYEKAQLDVSKVKKLLNSWVNLKFGYETVEPHYLRIKPLIIAEELLENADNFSTSLVDYKVYCFDGKPFCILVCTDRVIGKQSRFSYYDCNWNLMPNVLNEKLRGTDILIPKPKKLEQLLGYAGKLANGHPQVRVDFYITNDKIYFGEMTFTSEGGYDGDVTKEFCLEMGEKITLPIDKK